MTVDAPVIQLVQDGVPGVVFRVFLAQGGSDEPLRRRLYARRSWGRRSGDKVLVGPVLRNVCKLPRCATRTSLRPKLPSSSDGIAARCGAKPGATVPINARSSAELFMVAPIDHRADGAELVTLRHPPRWKTRRSFARPARPLVRPGPHGFCQRSRCPKSASWGQDHRPPNQ